MDPDLDTDSDIVRWVASQSPNPALQALMKEAERERKTRPSTPVHEPMSWTYPLTDAPSSTSLSASAASPWHNPADTSYPLALSGSSSAPVSGAPLSRRAKPLFAAQRNPLSASASFTNPPLRDSTRPRSSSYSTTLSHTSKTTYIPQEEEPEAMALIELLRDVSRQLDQNAEKKQRLAIRTKEKERERSLGRSSIDNRTGLDVNKSSARLLTKTSSASAIYPVGSSTRSLETTFRTSVSTFKSESRGRVLEKTGCLGAPGVDLVSGKSAPALLPHVNLNCDLKLVPTRMSNIANTHSTTARKANAPESSPDDDDSAMQDVYDLTEFDMEWEKPMSASMSCIGSSTYMQVDDDDMCNNTTMDVSFVQAELPSQTRVAASKPKAHLSQSNTASHPPVPTQRTRPGPPPLGMRRVPQHQPPQYNLSQGPKGVTVPRFKPPLLAHTKGTTNTGGSRRKLASTIRSTSPPCRGTKEMAVAETVVRGNQDADSSFDVSFGIDADSLEEAMKAYD